MPSISSRRARPCLELLEERCLLSNFGLGDTVRVSQGDPFANSDADGIEFQSGKLYPATAVETFLVVDPTNPDHLAGIWQQDRWSTGGARGLVVGISLDGGRSWQDTPLPGVSLVTGGTAARASDPWLAFAPNGDLFATALTVNAFGFTEGVLVSKSTDGGLTWQAPVAIPNPSRLFVDKESITTDPSNPQIVYVVWTGAYSVSTDGGQTFTPAQRLPTGSGSQIVVLPDGTLVDSDACEVFRSTDQGQTWGPRIPVPNCSYLPVGDPNTGAPLRAGLGLGDLAVDPNSGTLYIVIEDATFSGGQHDSIAFTQSTDGGFTWSRPVAVNQTPTDIPNLDQQAFIPTVQVAADGTVGVTYYDFRFNQQGPDLPADYWFVPGTPDGLGGITWGDELRLTDKSFNFEDAPLMTAANFGKFVGDYQGRASAGNDLLNLFGHPDGGLGDAIFFRRVLNAPAVADHFLLAAPLGATVGTPETLTVTAQDAVGNTVTGYTGTVHFTSSDPQALLPADYTFTAADKGQHSFSIIFQNAGTQSVTATDTAQGTLTGSLSLNVGPAIPIQPGQTAGIGFWDNKNGQALINSFNGGADSTALANWLAVTFPNLYGAGAGDNNLTGKTNVQVAAFYLSLFKLQGPKLDAQVLATALNVYATTASLGGSAATPYGFQVTADGLGAASYNVGSSGDAFGVPNNTTLNVFQLLKATDQKAKNGVLYSGDKTLREEAIDVFDGINEAGDF